MADHSDRNSTAYSDCSYDEHYQLNSSENVDTEEELIGVANTHHCRSNHSKFARNPQKINTVMISGISIRFIHKPYPCQVALMSKVIRGLKLGRNCLLESPTGTGKTLALLSSLLGWLENEKNEMEERRRENEERRLSEMKAAGLKGKKVKDLQESRLSDQASTRKDGFEKSSDNPTVEKNDDNLKCSRKSKERREVEGDFEEADDDFKPIRKHRKITYELEEPEEVESSFESNVTLTNDDCENQPEPSKPSFRQMRIPKIYFGTRTHQQISQVIRELRKSCYGHFKSVILASRSHTCVNPDAKGKDVGENCRALVHNSIKFNRRSKAESIGCMWYENTKRKLNWDNCSIKGLPNPFDLEELVQATVNTKCCGYYATRNLMSSADIIFCPYNYLIDPAVRETMQISLEGNIIVLDEGHNTEDVCREAASETISLNTAIMPAYEEVQNTPEVAPVDVSPIKLFLSAFVKLITNLDKEDKIVMDFDEAKSGLVMSATDFVGMVSAFGYTNDLFMSVQNTMAELKELDDPESISDSLVTKQTIIVVESLMRCIHYITTNDAQFADDFKVVFKKVYEAPTKKFRNRSSASRFDIIVNILCLNSAVIFQEINEKARSVIVASGTLSPLGSFSSELSASFPIILEANHVISRNQVYAQFISCGPSGSPLTGNFKNSESYDYQDQLGKIILDICQTAQQGVLCFLPSYRVLSNVLKRWEDTGIISKIQVYKSIKQEMKSRSDNAPKQSQNDKTLEQTAAFATLFPILDDPDTDGCDTSKENLFLAVYRGKASEGMDFSDDMARVVVCVGIPFPSAKDTQILLKREYNNITCSKKKNYLNGSKWYEIQAFRALNQAMGRCIRHKSDWGAIFLVDDRYGLYSNYKNYLARWIQPYMRQPLDWKTVLVELQKFFNEMNNRSLKENAESDLESTQLITSSYFQPCCHPQSRHICPESKEVEVNNSIHAASSSSISFSGNKRPT